MKFIDYFKKPQTLTISLDELRTIQFKKSDESSALATKITKFANTITKPWQLIGNILFTDEDMYRGLQEAFPKDFIGDYPGGCFISEWMDTGFQYDTNLQTKDNKLLLILSRKYPGRSITFQATGS